MVVTMAAGGASTKRMLGALAPQHVRPIRCDRRLLVVLLLLCVVVSVQSAALSAESKSHQPTDHCCLLCHVGPLPFLQTSVSAALAPVFQVVWLAPPAHSEPTLDAPPVPGSSRAPPAA
ncbi:conserved exported hypothetical protein [Candidatus Sulfopaludibacter sp. SbA6]|nr:conserved exported hypothetical protein [Candidatus Sulfopaludibacter sp. SbA6]